MMLIPGRISSFFVTRVLRVGTKCFSASSTNDQKHSCKLLIVGGGTAGCSLAAKFSKKLNKNDIIVLEPSQDHYYQPLFTLVGGGMEKLEDTRKNEKECLPDNCVWINDSAVKFEPKTNLVLSEKGHQIRYEYLVVAVGLLTRYERIPGLIEGLSNPKSGVCSNYSPKYVSQVFPNIERLNEGNAIFTFPATPIKCPGAPQKICYITDDYLRKVGKRDKVNLIYNTSLPVIFGVKKYADALWKICRERNITVNTRTNLISIDNSKKEAVFENLDKPGETKIQQFSLLHVCPPMSTPDCLTRADDLTNEAGFVDVDKSTLQHVRYPNVFSLGDCSSTPNSKTAAAAAAQSVVVFKNLDNVMKGQKAECIYDGYASCPIVTGYDKCILAEFDYDLKPLETFPLSQDKERYSMFLLKKNIIPQIYWKMMLNGLWNGPKTFRKIMHLGIGK